MSSDLRASSSTRFRFEMTSVHEVLDGRLGCNDPSSRFRSYHLTHPPGISADPEIQGIVPGLPFQCTHGVSQHPNLNPGQGFRNHTRDCKSQAHRYQSRHQRFKVRTGSIEMLLCISSEHRPFGFRPLSFGTGHSSDQISPTFCGEMPESSRNPAAIGSLHIWGEINTVILTIYSEFSQIQRISRPRFRNQIDTYICKIILRGLCAKQKVAWSGPLRPRLRHRSR